MIATTSDGVALWWDHQGEGPAVLLVPGRGDASDLFPEEFALRLREGGLSTVRWDPRDTGLSGDGGSSYTVATMADDAGAVLDAAGIEAAHIVGVSMAGLIMIHLANRHATRVASLSFISAMSPDPSAGMGDDFFSALESDDPVAELVRAMGDASAADRAWAVSEVASAELRAPRRPDAVARHQEAAFRLEWPTMENLAGIAVPTLVIHGHLDRVLPPAHARALATGIEQSSVIMIDGMGHLPRRGDWALAAGLILDHVGG